MNNCVLCLSTNAETFSLIYSQSNEWNNFNIQSIIEKHFWWLHFEHTSTILRWICRQCWKELSSFHTFYIKVEKLHKEYNQFKWPMLCSENAKNEGFIKTDKGVAQQKSNKGIKNMSDYMDSVLANKSIEHFRIHYQFEENHSDNTNKELMPIEELTRNGKNIQNIVDAINKETITSDVDDVQHISYAEKDIIEINDSMDSDSWDDLLEPMTIVYHYDEKAFTNSNEHELVKKVNYKDHKQAASVDDEDTNKVGGYISTDWEDHHLDTNENVKSNIDEMQHISKDHVFINEMIDCMSTGSVDHTFEPQDHYEGNGLRKVKKGRIEEEKSKMKRKQLKRTVGELKTIRSKNGFEITRKNNEYLAQSDYKLLCHICNIPLKDFVYLKKHFYQKHRISGYAMCCKKKLFSLGMLVDHLRVHDDPNYFKCNICGQILDDGMSYENHLKYHKQSSEKRELIFDCDKSIYLEKGGEQNNAPTARVKLHKKKMHADKNQLELLCPYCSKVSTNRSSHRHHINYVHIMKRIHGCHMCEKKFKRPLELKEHLSTHTGEHLYTCAHCPRTFKNRSYMHSHRKVVHPKEWLKSKIQKLTAQKQDS